MEGLGKKTPVQVFEGPLGPGDHTLSVTWIFRSPRAALHVLGSGSHAFTVVADKPAHQDARIDWGNGKTALQKIRVTFIEAMEGQHSGAHGRDEGVADHRRARPAGRRAVRTRATCRGAAIAASVLVAAVRRNERGSARTYGRIDREKLRDLGEAAP